MATINRKELYKKVWEMPITQLSKEYGLSDVGLAKICKKHNVPRPPRGYWARKVQTPLRNIAKNTGLNEATAVDGRSTASLLQQ